jgi:hypothetical protein
MIRPNASLEENSNANPNFLAGSMGSKDGIAIRLLIFTADLGDPVKSFGAANC